MIKVKEMASKKSSPLSKKYLYQEIDTKVFLIFIVLIIILVVLGSLYFFKKNSQTIVSSHIANSTPTNVNSRIANFTPANFSGKCSKYGDTDKRDFLPTYKVVAGDTLLSITSKQLGDPSRVNQLINLNHDYYPSLSLTAPFLEPGWILVLPPKYINTAASFTIGETSGEITQINPNRMWFVGMPMGSTYFIPDSNTKYIGKKTFQVGDCISFIWTNNNQDNIRTYSISLQK